MTFLFFYGEAATTIDRPGQADILRSQTFFARHDFVEIVLQKWRCNLRRGVG